MARTAAAVIACLSAGVLSAQPFWTVPVATAATSETAPQCRPDSTLARVAELYEGSGVAASRRTPGRFWAHNDSGDPVLYALDAAGAVADRVRLAGAKVEDWEALTVGPCAAGSCLYVGDIGDNDAERRRITVYRAAEPDLSRVEKRAASRLTVAAEAIHATYPDGAHDAEALFVAPDGRLHIVTKGDTGPVALYRFPSELRAGATVRLERVGAPRSPGQPDKDGRITDGAIDPDGRWVVLRSTSALMVYSAPDLLAGRWRELGRISLESLREPQGEGLTFVPGGGLALVGEGGRNKEPGTFVRMRCTWSVP